VRLKIPKEKKMENVQTMSDLMQQIQQRIDSLKASAMQQQTEMKQSLNECIEQSEAIQNQLVQSQQQLTSQLEYGTAVLIELEQGLQLDFSTEIAEFEQLCQNETADTAELTQRLEQHVQEKITFQLNELKAKTGIALQEIGQVTLHIKQLFGAEKSAKVKGLAKLKQRLYKRFGKQIIASKECLAKQLERGASKLRA
jgi:raw score 10.90